MTRKPILHDTPEPQAAPPQPKGTGCLRVLKQMYRTWVAAGGTPINGWH